MIGGHGHVIPRPDGAKARCGGPRLCEECAREQALQGVIATPAPVGGADASPSPVGGLKTNVHDQTGPGFIATTHGARYRPEPPWDVPAGPDYPGRPLGPLADALAALDVEIQAAEEHVTGLRDLRVQLVHAMRPKADR